MNQVNSAFVNQTRIRSWNQSVLITDVNVVMLKETTEVFVWARAHD